MASLQIGKYKRPGIFIEEYDQSVIASQTIQGIVNTVIGVSKKGPINAPILIKNTADLQNIFGSVDRNLERKGSYFHRTIAKMLESSPVYAINLLATDDTLDKIDYKPLSVTTDKANDLIKSGPYRRFYNYTGFWKKDAESFLDLTSANTNYQDRLFNITNMSDKFITVFIFKSTITGYDRTMIDYLGSVENIPLFVYPTDYVSDYMVDVVVVGGDWSNYSALAVDSKWSKYFDTTGLRKSQVNNFVNDNNVTLLKYYQGLSFIPYFKDLRNQNIFIETVINKDTDLTGLFCAFNTDLIDTDYPNGKIDLIGNNLLSSGNLVDSGVTDIEFLSYKNSIVEYVSYNNVILDRPGNVLAIGTYSRVSGISNLRRTDWYSEGLVSGITRGTSSATFSNSAITFNWNNTSYNGVDSFPYVIIGGNKIAISGTASFTMSASDYGSFSTTQSYYVAFTVDTSGNITNTKSTTPDTKPNVATTDVVLGYLGLTLSSGKITGTSYTDVSVNTTRYLDLVYGTDYTISSLGDNTFKVEFVSTAAAPSVSNYKQYRRIKLFNSYRNILESTNVGKACLMVDLGGGYVKRSLGDMNVLEVITSTTTNKSFTIKTNFGVSETIFNSTVLTSLQNTFILYVLDNEQIFSDYKMITTNNAVVSLTGTSSYGIVSKYSDIYLDFYQGIINSGDYFYVNILNYSANVIFKTVSGYSYIIINGTSQAPFDVETYQHINVPASLLNTGNLIISDATNYAIALGYTATDYAYKLEESVVAETLTSATKIYDASNKFYLSMYNDSSNNLTIKITDSSLSTANLMGSSLLALNQILNIKSNKSNYKETLEIVIPTNYTQVPNKILINGTRYTNVKVGDFLEAYVDTDSLVEGQIPKRLTRILTKRVYSGDSSLVEITCDARIATFAFGSSYQTMKYSSIDNYVTTYQAITLKGFRIREASLPDGTETRQSSILNLVSKGTPLFRSITNKEMFDFRYLIDSFGLGLIELSKQQLVDICGERLDCLGFINMPSMKSFKNSSSPSFKNSEGVLQTSFIAAGGDIDSNPAFLYSFGEGRGTSTVGYFTPYLTINDNGRPTEVPPAMHVATTYMRKQNSNVTSIVPWTIAAGVSDGRITNIAGVEMDFDNIDIENLNGASMNPIVIKKNRGWVIETENTAQTLVKSALSYLHVREVLIELERELAAMLLNFQWKFNTPEIRSEIKLRADVICAKYVSKNGLYDYFNKCDDENNTTTLIDNQLGVLDTYVEPIKGLAAIVNNVTVLKTGVIQSGGFTV